MSGIDLVMCHLCSYLQGFRCGVGAKFSNLDQAVCLAQPYLRYRIPNILKNNDLSNPISGIGFSAVALAATSLMDSG